MTLDRIRIKSPHRLPQILEKLSLVTVKKGDPTTAVADADKLKQQFTHLFGQPTVELVSDEQTVASKQLKIGVVLSGGQAPGGHNVIAGLFDALQELHSKSQLIGFLGGPSGVVDNKSLEISRGLIDRYRNLGGFDIIGSGRTKIESEEQLHGALVTCERNGLDGLVIIGGDDSNTNAAVLAEYFLSTGCSTKVVGVPKTIDGDLKNEQIEISFGHDTACKVYAELIGNLMRDAMSARKYYHFVRLMGRSASHITLECALKTHPNVTLISEEIAKQQLTLDEIATSIAEVVQARADQGKHYGVVLIPEGLIEFVPEVGLLIGELNNALAEEKGIEALSDEAKRCYESLPESIQKQLLLDRDPHGNVQVSRIETEHLLLEMVKEKVKMSALGHFFGYEGRSAMPSQFDCDYCYALGFTAVALVQAGLTGYMSSVTGLTRPVADWAVGGIPITMMMNLEERHGKPKPVIRKALVDLNGPAYQHLVDHRESWAFEDHFGYPGPVQFFGPSELVEEIPITLSLEHR